jgi:hypothetical protein
MQQVLINTPATVDQTWYEDGVASDPGHGDRDGDARGRHGDCDRCSHHGCRGVQRRQCPQGARLQLGDLEDGAARSTHADLGVGDARNADLSCRGRRRVSTSRLPSSRRVTRVTPPPRRSQRKRSRTRASQRRGDHRAGVHVSFVPRAKRITLSGERHDAGEHPDLQGSRDPVGLSRRSRPDAR